MSYSSPSSDGDDALILRYRSLCSNQGIDKVLFAFHSFRVVTIAFQIQSDVLRPPFCAVFDGISAGI